MGTFHILLLFLYTPSYTASYKYYKPNPHTNPDRKLSGFFTIKTFYFFYFYKTRMSPKRGFVGFSSLLDTTLSLKFGLVYVYAYNPKWKTSNDSICPSFYSTTLAILCLIGLMVIFVSSRLSLKHRLACRLSTGSAHASIVHRAVTVSRTQRS